MERVKDDQVEGEGKEGNACRQTPGFFLLFPHPLFLILALAPIFRAKTPFFGLSMLPNPTEMLAA